MDLSRQSNLIDSKKLSEIHVELYGIGSVGSWLALGLAKIGVPSISVWDFDTVEEANCSAQAFGMNQVGQLKTEALFNLIKDQTNTKIDIHSEEIKEETELDPRMESIQYCGVDSLKARQLIFDKLNGLPVYWLDSRIGGFEHSYTFLRLDDETKVARYEKTLKPIKGISYELKCGEKASIGNNVMLISEIMSNIVKLINGEKYYYNYISNFLGKNPFTKC